MKAFFYIVGSLFIGALAWQVFNVWSTGRALTIEADSVLSEVEGLRAENNLTKEELYYFGNTANLEKALRAKFDYKLPNEKLIKIR